MKTRAILTILVLPFAACLGDAPTPLGWTVDTGGPRVVFDLEARPLPEIPLPNDVATRLDPTSPTGRRLNVSERATTQYESRTRQQFNTLDGFGTYTPLTVSFSQPLDLADLRTRHTQNVDFRDDAVFVLNVDKSCKRFGEEVSLDFGSGRFPITLYRRARQELDPAAPSGMRLPREALFTQDGLDPHGTANNLLFEEHHEDLDGDGQLDPGEDEDADGRLDVPNFLDTEACRGLAPRTRTGTVNSYYRPVDYDRCVADNLLSWYERETDTLILRPLWPLEERCTYAVVLTSRLRGADGKAVVSPFVAVHHRDQRLALDPVPGLLARYGLGAADITFAWSFTTGSMTRDLEVLREGLYGSGPFARLATEFPTERVKLWRDEAQAETLLPGTCAAHAMSRFWRVLGEWSANRCALESDLAAIGGIAGGVFEAPNLLVDKDGRATPRYPDDQDESWRMDAERGEAVYGRTNVSFWCALPKEDTSGRCEPGNPRGQPYCRPFPTILYAHGYGGARSEITSGHIGRTTAMGYAMCALDAYGHGLNRLLDVAASTEASFFRGRLEAELGDLGIAGFSDTLMRGRDRDLDNDGAADPGGDMWTSDVFHTRDMVRQTVLEYVQFVRTLRSVDGARRDVDGHLLGDLDGDGRVDLGGASNTIGMWGISLGGIIAGVAAGAEPTLDAVSPNAGGAGLVDVAVRSSQAGVPEAVVMPVMGPFVEGCVAVDEHDRPTPPGVLGRGCFSETLPGGVLEWGYRLSQLNRSLRLKVGTVEGVTAGDEVLLENLVNGESASVRVSGRGAFRTAVAADAMPPIPRRALFAKKDDDREPMVASASTLAALGDRLRLTITRADGRREVIDTFPNEVSYMGTVYPAGLPLVALQEGLGLRRNSPRFRRFLGFASMAIGPADPAAWAVRVRLDRADTSYDPAAPLHHTRVLAMPTAGDVQVPVNTGIALARAGGILGSWLRDPDRFGPEVGWRELFAPHPDHGRSVDQVLIDNFVIEGDPRFQRFGADRVQPNVVFDVDDVSDGRATFTCGNSDWSGQNGENGCSDALRGQEVYFSVPRLSPPLRHQIALDDGTHDAFRVPVLRPAGQHGIYNAQPFRTFDADAFMVNFTTRFLGTRGRAVDHPGGCDCSASRMATYALDGQPSYPSLERACTLADLRVCSPECAAAWGITTPEAVSCVPASQ